VFGHGYASSFNYTCILAVNKAKCFGKGLCQNDQPVPFLIESKLKLDLDNQLIEEWITTSPLHKTKEGKSTYKKVKAAQKTSKGKTIIRIGENEIPLNQFHMR
jgi:hypothetical protein